MKKILILLLLTFVCNAAFSAIETQGKLTITQNSIKWDADEYILAKDDTIYVNFGKKEILYFEPFIFEYKSRSSLDEKFKVEDQNKKIFMQEKGGKAIKNKKQEKVDYKDFITAKPGYLITEEGTRWSDTIDNKYCYSYVVIKQTDLPLKYTFDGKTIVVKEFNPEDETRIINDLKKKYIHLDKLISQDTTITSAELLKNYAIVQPNWSEYLSNGVKINVKYSINDIEIKPTDDTLRLNEDLISWAKKNDSIDFHVKYIATINIGSGNFSQEVTVQNTLTTIHYRKSSFIDGFVNKLNAISPLWYLLITAIELIIIVVLIVIVVKAKKNNNKKEEYNESVPKEESTKSTSSTSPIDNISTDVNEIIDTINKMNDNDKSKIIRNINISKQKIVEIFNSKTEDFDFGKVEHEPKTEPKTEQSDWRSIDDTDMVFSKINECIHKLDTLVIDNDTISRYLRSMLDGGMKKYIEDWNDVKETLTKEGNGNKPEIVKKKVSEFLLNIALSDSFSQLAKLHHYIEIPELKRRFNVYVVELINEIYGELEIGLYYCGYDIISVKLFNDMFDDNLHDFSPICDIYDIFGNLRLDVEKGVIIDIVTIGIKVRDDIGDDLQNISGTPGTILRKSLVGINQ